MNDNHTIPPQQPIVAWTENKAQSTDTYTASMVDNNKN